MFNLDIIITSKTRLAVMRFFLQRAVQESGVRETARALNLNPMQVRNELILLQKAGLLKSRKVANSVQYSLDSSCAAHPPLQRLFDLSVPIEAEVNDEKKPNQLDEVSIRE